MDTTNNIICILLIFFLCANRIEYNALFTGKHVNISVPRRLTIFKLNLASRSDPSVKEHVLDFFNILGYTPTTLVQDIQKIKGCVEDIQVYRNKQKNSTIAYVAAFKFTRVMFRINRAVFVNTEYWDKLPSIVQEKALIHECSHLTLTTIDHAYSDSPLFYKLKGLQAKQNADTFTEVIMTLAKSANDVAVDSIESFF